MVRTLGTAQEALDFVLEQQDSDGVLPAFQLTGELSALEIAIHGAQYHGKLTGELAKGIGDFQDEIYRAANYVLQGLKDRRLSLSQDEKKAFQLKVEVTEGCTLLKIDFGDVAKTLAKKLGEVMKMNPKTTAATIALVVLIIYSAGVVERLGGKALDNAAQLEALKTQVDLAEKIQKGDLAIIDALRAAAGPDGERVSSRFAQAQEQGVRDIAKSAPDATKIRVNSMVLDEDALGSLKARSERALADELVIEFEKFKVWADTKSNPLKLTLGSASLPNEMVVYMDNDQYSPEEYDVIWQAIREKTEIYLDVQAVLLRGEAKRGTIKKIYTDQEVKERIDFDDLFGTDTSGAAS